MGYSDVSRANLIAQRGGGSAFNASAVMPNAFASAADTSMGIAQGALNQQSELVSLMRKSADQQVQITNDILPELKGMAGQVRGMADKQMGMADDIYGRAQKFTPVEAQLIADAQAGTHRDIEGKVGQASADMAQQFKTAGDDKRRMMMAYGINPNSGKFAASADSMANEQALQTAGAVSRTRSAETATADDRDFSRRATVANMGTNLTGQAATVASGAGAALGGAMNAYSNVIDASGKPLQAYGAAIQGAGAALGGASNLFNTQSQLGMMQAQNEQEAADDDLRARMVTDSGLFIPNSYSMTVTGADPYADAKQKKTTAENWLKYNKG